MSCISNHAISAGLIVAGMVTCVLAGRPLTSNPEAMVPLNPMGINRSPYGELLAMAMQAPIAQYWQKGFEERASTGKNGATPTEDEDSATKRPKGGLYKFVDSLEAVSHTRTNPKPPSAKQKLHIRREIENKLRFAYELDPSHYANYNSYHFFLTEPELGTRPELTPGAAKLAEKTIQYCLSRKDDPRPSLTAAAAAENVLLMMYNDQLNDVPRFTTAQMRQYLAMLDYCISQYHHISDQWEKDGKWNNLSIYRQEECKDRLHFIMAVRDDTETIIERFENKSPDPNMKETSRTSSLGTDH